MDIEIVKSPLDDRLYQFMQLPNGLKVLIVSDPNTKESASSMDVKVGMLDDPIEAQGLAHFLEHMLFMGSEKYPSQNDYSAFVQANGGDANASTDLMSTKFYFSITNSAFLPALDRFSQFFIAPLLMEDCINREMHAVDSEFKLSVSDDDSRIWE